MAILKQLFIYEVIVLSAVGGFVFAQTQNGTVLPDPGITPESRFYFFDKFGEALREFFTFSPEGKARLQIMFAAERIAEIKIILETKGIEAEGLEIAQFRLRAHLGDAAAIVADEKAGGKDVSGFAEELDEAFEGPKIVLEETLKAYKRALEDEENALKRKIKEARRAGDVVAADVLAQQLDEVKARKELLELHEEEQEEALEREEERLEEAMELRAEAEKKIGKADRNKQEILDEAARNSVSLPPETFNALDRHIAEAKSALAAGAFDAAKHRAEEAIDGLKAIEDAFEDLKETKEEEEELQEEREKIGGEDEEGADERAQDAENDADRLELEKEMDIVVEEIKNAEKRLREAGMVEEDDD